MTRSNLHHHRPHPWHPHSSPVHVTLADGPELSVTGGIRPWAHPLTTGSSLLPPTATTRFSSVAQTAASYLSEDTNSETHVSTTPTAVAYACADATKFLHSQGDYATRNPQKWVA